MFGNHEQTVDVGLGELSRGLAEQAEELKTATLWESARGVRLL